MNTNSKRLMHILVIVAVALGIPSLYAGLNMNDMRRVNSARSNLEKALAAYFGANGSYPKTLDELGAPALIIDPWRQQFHYLMPGKHNPDKYDLWSGGPNGTLVLANWDSPDNHAIAAVATPSGRNPQQPPNQPGINPAFLPKAATENTNVTHLRKGEKIYHPSDKLPNDVAGIHIAGRFVTKCMFSDGLGLVAASDANNPFARLFVVTNISTGVAPGQLAPMAQRLITIPESQPLEIIGRGLPGIYNVNAPNPNF